MFVGGDPTAQPLLFVESFGQRQIHVPPFHLKGAQLMNAGDDLLQATQFLHKGATTGWDAAIPKHVLLTGYAETRRIRTKCAAGTALELPGGMGLRLQLGFRIFRRFRQEGRVYALHLGLSADSVEPYPVLLGLEFAVNFTADLG